jgi:hypothetical protein
MPTVPIPAEIVGDHDTIQKRYRVGEVNLANVAQCSGEQLAETGELGRHFPRRLIELSRTALAVHGEWDRRLEANRMAHAIQPDGEVWRWRA